MSTSVMVCADRSVIAARALDLLVEGLRAAIARRGEGHLALTGGSSAAALFEQLRDDERSDRVDWSRVHVWQGDERFVPLDHPDRNWAGALRDWLEHEQGDRFAGARLHPIPVEAALDGGHDQAWAARRYAEELEESLPRRDGLPAFDVLLLGVGGDGHILSTFPGNPALVEASATALGVPAPTHIEPHLPRVTVAPSLVRPARSVVVMVPGASKSDVVAACFGSPRDPKRLPAQLAIRPQAVWLLDPGSASGLRSSASPAG